MNSFSYIATVSEDSLSSTSNVDWTVTDSADDAKLNKVGIIERIENRIIGIEKTLNHRMDNLDAKVNGLKQEIKTVSYFTAQLISSSKQYRVSKFFICTYCLNKWG